MLVAPQGVSLSVSAGQQGGDEILLFSAELGAIIFLRIVVDMASGASDDTSMKFWLRAESKPHEQRTPLTPVTCKKLLSAGMSF